MSEVKASPKSPRPLHSKSEPFEAGYATFMADVFEKNIKSVETVETLGTRMVVLAGEYRLRLDKKTGLLHSEYFKPATATSAATWSAGRFQISSLWAASAEFANAIQNAWHLRLAWFVPSAHVCFATVVKDGWMFEPEDQWANALSRAAARRLGGRDTRLRLVKAFVAALWNFLVDRETLKLCHAYFGRKASLEDYNFTVRRRAEMSARFAETPNLARVMGTFLKSAPKLKSGRYRIPPDILSQARNELFSPRPHQPTLTPAGWRFFASLTPASVDKLWQVAGNNTPKPGVELISMLNLISRTGERPPLTFLMWLQQELLRFERRMSPEAYAGAQESLIRFFRLAGQQAVIAKKKGKLKRFVSGELLLALDWLKQREPHHDYYDGHDIVRVPKNATWASVMRAQQMWHAEMEERERIQREADERANREYVAQRDAISWISQLAGCEVMGATVTPLVTGKELREEGDRMKHCVVSYIDYCAEGTSRIFAIKHQEDEATLELVETNNRSWKVRQVFGSRNTEVSPLIEKISRTVARMYKAAARETDSVAA